MIFNVYNISALVNYDKVLKAIKVSEYTLIKK